MQHDGGRIYQRSAPYNPRTDIIRSEIITTPSSRDLLEMMKVASELEQTMSLTRLHLR